MSDLIGGRYPATNEEWLADGMPFPPYRQTISRRDIVNTGVTMTSATLYIFPLTCQAGDIIGAISVGVKTASATPTHGWAALYSGVTAASVLLAQSADNVSGFTPTAGAQKFTFATPFLVGGNPGTPQGSGQPAAGSSGPIVLGLALYNSATTGGVLDGMSGSNVAGAVIVTGQVPFALSVSLAATATAPATLAGAVAAIQGVPYAVATRS